MLRKVTPHTTVLLAAFSAALLTSAAASASGTSVTITTNWDGTTNSWTSAADWSTTPYYPNNGSPIGTDYDAVINASEANGYTVTLSTSVNVNSLAIDNTGAILHQTSGTLDMTQQPSGTAGGTLDVEAGTYELDNGSTLANAALTVESGAFLVDWGTLQNVVLGSNLTLSPIQSIDAGSDYAYIANTTSNPVGLNLHGNTLTLLGTGLAYQDAHNSSTGQYVGDSINGVVNMTGSSVTDATIQGGNGGLTIDTGSTVAASSAGYNVICGTAVTNQGTISATSGPLLIDSDTFTNAGTVAISGTGRVLDLGKSFGDYATVAWSNTGAIQADSYAATAATETINLYGTFHPSDVGLASSGTNGVFTPNGAKVNIYGTLDNTGNTLTFNNSAGVWNLATGGMIKNGTLSTTSLNVINATLQNVTLGSDLTLSANDGNPNDHLNVYINNTVGNSMGLDLDGHTLNVQAAELSYQDTYNSSTGQYVGETINGNVNLYGASISGGEGGLLIGSGMTVTAFRGQYSSTDQLGGSAVTNDGTIAVSGGAYMRIGNPFTNAGTISISGNGTSLTLFGGSWTNNGSIQADSNPSVAATEVITLAGTFLPSDVGLASSGGNAVFNPNGATVNIWGTLDNTGNTLTFNSSTGVWNLNTNGTIKNGTLIVASQTGGAQYLNIITGTLQNVTLGSNLNLPAYTGSSYGFRSLYVANTTNNPLGLDLNGHTLTISAEGATFGPSYLQFEDAYDASTGQYVGGTINGDVNLVEANYSASIYAGKGGLTVAPGGAITVSDAPNFIGGQGYIVGDNITNDGTLNAVGGAALIVEPYSATDSFSFTNVGTITMSKGSRVFIAQTTSTSTNALTAGRLEYAALLGPTSSWTQEGTLAVDTGATISLGNPNSSALDVVFGSNSVLQIQIGSGTTTGLIDLVNAQLTIDNGAEIKVLALPGTSSSGSYDFLNYVGSAPTGKFTLETPGYILDYTSTPGEILITPVPDPSVLALAAIGGLAALAIRRRRV